MLVIVIRKIFAWSMFMSFGGTLWHYFRIGGELVLFRLEVGGGGGGWLEVIRMSNVFAFSLDDSPWFWALLFL